MAVELPTDRTEAYVVAGALGLFGLGLVVVALNRGGGGGGGTGLKPGETMQNPTVAGVQSGGLFPLALSDTWTLPAPTVIYSGPGRNTYCYAQVKQRQGNQLVSVMGSGVAGLALPNTPIPTSYALVSHDQPQPCGQPPAAQLILWPWAQLQGPICGHLPTGLCGAPAVPGSGDLYIEIYQDAVESGNPVDADGFSSPTCNNRIPLKYRGVYPGAVNFH